MTSLALADPARSTAIRTEIGTAWGRLWADAPRLAARLEGLAGYSNVLVTFLRGVDHYRATYAVDDVQVDTWRTGDEIRHRFNAKARQPAATIPRFVGPEWFIARTTRLADVASLPWVLDAMQEIVRHLDDFTAAHRTEPTKVAEVPGYPKFIRGLTYIVHRLEVVGPS